MSGIDLSFVSGKEKFNYRVCAVIISGGRLLAMHDERSPYYYLPGGRVQMGETAEAAVVREVREELEITSEIVRPLWLNQAFFTEDVDGLHYHELCLYFLMDVSHTDLLSKGEKFTLLERHHTHEFEWLPFDRLEQEYFYPLFPNGTGIDAKRPVRFSADRALFILGGYFITSSPFSASTVTV